jgi:hypothetical protein
VKLRALREVKNQIIGNRTKKLSFLKLGAVPAVAAALSQAQADLLIQSAAVLGSFACGFDAGVRAVLDAGAFPNLINLLSYPDEKVMNMNSIPFFFFWCPRNGWDKNARKCNIVASHDKQQFYTLFSSIRLKTSWKFSSRRPIWLLVKCGQWMKETLYNSAFRKRDTRLK